MKNRIQTLLITTLILLISTLTLKAQDQIITMKGGTVHGHVKKVRNDEIVYRKYFHRYKIPTSKVLYIVYENGSKTVINNITMAKNYKNYSQMAKSSPPSKADTLSSKTGGNASFKPHYIERIGDKFRIDTTSIIGAGKLNELMTQSPNPIVAVNLKAAKTMRAFCIASKISSYPGSAGGAFASYNTFTTLFNQMKAGPISAKSYITAGLSFVGTLTLPITSAVLTHIQRKLYDKMLLAYSLGN